MIWAGKPENRGDFAEPSFAPTHRTREPRTLLSRALDGAFTMKKRALFLLTTAFAAGC
jgi:hypothetical protein